jgi:peroxiredoxin
MNQSKLEVVDWTRIPQPEDDGATSHLAGMSMPRINLLSTSGGEVDVGNLKGLSIIFFYPMTGQPDIPLPEGWDEIPGARGCTPQSCAFRDYYSSFINRGVRSVFGISTQDTQYQKEASNRLHLPYPLLSDYQLLLTTGLRLPTMQVAGMTLIKRITLVLRENVIEKVFYPVFPPDENAADVMKYLTSA